MRFKTWEWFSQYGSVHNCSIICQFTHCDKSCSERKLSVCEKQIGQISEKIIFSILISTPKRVFKEIGETQEGSRGLDVQSQ